jgi:hypothetical protein
MKFPLGKEGREFAALLTREHDFTLQIGWSKT